MLALLMDDSRGVARSEPAKSLESVAPWARPGEVVLADLDVEPTRGLTASDATARAVAFGPNTITGAPKASPWRILVNQFKSLVIGLLIAAALVSLLFGSLVEAAAIFVVIVVNAMLGFFTELRGVRSMEALRRLGVIEVRVRRDGAEEELAAEALVPGDVVLFEGGDLVAADIRLIEAWKMAANESTLTGESVPVNKSTEPVDAGCPLAERTCMLFRGTSVTRGSGEGVVVSTGAATELGQIAALVGAAERASTPLERRLEELGRKLIWVALAMAALTTLLGILSGHAVLLMLETGIALAVAAIPEGLPIVATIALARGMWRMSRRNALINRLSAVETLGATNIIFSDKTGTLTENRMTVTRLVTASGEIRVTGVGADLEGEFRTDAGTIELDGERVLRRMLEVGVLCSNASLATNGSGGVGVGDPLEVALLVLGAKGGLRRQDLLQAAPEVREEAFDPTSRMMATFHKTADGLRVAVKGGTEAVLDAAVSVAGTLGVESLSRSSRAAWLGRNDALASQGFRVLALAERSAESESESPYEALIFLGLLGMLDPPREDVAEALQACRGAGIRVVMVTGDQSLTSRSIANAVGLVDDPGAPVISGLELAELGDLSTEQRRQVLDTPIFARMNPRQKLDLIVLNQEAGNVVAMTGDGVNDAPALKKADIGIAMGRRGTQVAREAAEMVLLDDSFASIVVAIKNGRIIFENIRKFVFYLLSCNLSEIMIVSAAAVLGTRLPLLPLQILFLNLVTDVFPALALGMGKGDPDIMKQLPRHRDEPLLPRRYWVEIVVYGLVITATVIAAMQLAIHQLDIPPDAAVTVAFFTLALAQLWHVFNMRGRGSHIIANDVVRSPWVWAALALCVAILAFALAIPVARSAMSLVVPDEGTWFLIIGMSLVPLAVGQIWNSLASADRRGERRLS